MRRIIKDLNKANIENEVFTEIGNHLYVIIKKIQHENNDDGNSDTESEDELDHRLIHFHDDGKNVKITIKKKKKQKIAPKYIFIFDDISTDLKNPDVAFLVKQNRHYLSKVIISSQYPYDMKPESRRQQDYFLLFAGQPEDKLKKLYENIDLHITFETFKELYDQATSEKYHFLYIDTNNGEYRQDFNQQFII